MTQTEWFQTLAQRLDVTPEEVKRLIQGSAQVMKTVLDEDWGFTLPGLGTFHAAVHPSRKGYSPRLRRHVMLPTRRVVGYHPSAPLRTALKFKRVTP